MKITVSVDVPEATTADQVERVVAHLAEYAPSSLYIPVDRERFSLAGITLVSTEPSGEAVPGDVEDGHATDV